jgi:hypothetical protein
MSFTPVTIPLTFETQDELNRWGRIFDCSAFTISMGGQTETWRKFVDAGADMGGNPVIGLTFDEIRVLRNLLTRLTEPGE